VDALAGSRSIARRRRADRAESAPDLKTLIGDLKKLPGDATAGSTEKFLRDLQSRYTRVAN